MLHKTSIPFYCIVLVMLFGGCETPLDISELEGVVQSEKGIMAVSSTFSPNDIYSRNNSGFEVYLTPSQPLSASHSTGAIADADVALYTNEELIETLTFDPESQRYKTTHHTPMMDQDYQLIITHPDYETVEANSIVPKQVQLKSTTIVEKQSQLSDVFSDFYELHLKIELEIEDPAEIDNYYHFVFRNRVYGYNSNGYIDTSLIIQPSKSYEPLFSFELDRENEPSAFLVNENSPLAGAYLTDENFDGENKIITFSLVILTNPALPLADQMRVEMHSVTKDYYDFHLSAYQASNTGSNPLASTLPTVLSNIKNGDGLFSGYNSSYRIVRLK